jgi:hypothetical protein
LAEEERASQVPFVGSVDNPTIRTGLIKPIIDTDTKATDIDISPWPDYLR